MNNLGAPEKRLPACDLCYAKKIKCDREELCKNCVGAKVSCIRSRPKRRRATSAKKNPLDKTQNPGEYSVRTLREAAAPSSLGHYSCFSADSSPRELNGAGLNLELKEPESIAQGTSRAFLPSLSRDISCPTALADDTLRDPADYTNSTSDMIRQEIASQENLSSRQFAVLQSALSLVGKFGSSSHHLEKSTQHEKSSDNEPVSHMEFSPEIFYCLLGEHRNTHWPDHISSKTLERICLAMIDRTVSGQLALQHTLCILSKATIFISRWLRSCASQGLSNCLEQSRKSYVASSLQCLKSIDFTRAPSLSMLQALLSGASLVQLLGETSRSWFLTALASRGLVALGYHQLTPTFLASEESSEIRDCVFWCYYMDKTLSMLLVRPSSLPDFPFNPAALVRMDPENLLSYKVQILVRLAHVQDLYLNALAERQKNRPYPSNLVESLQIELYSVRLDILELRPKYTTTLILKSEWDAVDFTYFSIACTALRLDSIFLHDQKKREECVQCARKALKAMQECHTYVSTTSKSAPDSLFWTVLLYPLTPFFVIFCNIAATSNVDDLQLLKEATATVESIGEDFSFSMNLHKLLSQLIGLCSQLDLPGRPASIANNGDGPSNGKALLLPTISHAMRAEEWQEIQQSQEPMASDHDHAGTKRNSIWDGGLLWELFNIQPSVEWFDAGYDNFFDGQQCQVDKL